MKAPNREISRVARRILAFYEANPGSLLRPYDLRVLVGSREEVIWEACKHLKAEGRLTESYTGSQPSYRLRG